MSSERLDLALPEALFTAPCNLRYPNQHTSPRPTSPIPHMPFPAKPGLSLRALNAALEATSSVK